MKSLPAAPRTVAIPIDALEPLIDLIVDRVEARVLTRLVEPKATNNGQTTPGPSRTYSVRQAAQVLGVGRNAIYELVRTGQLGALRLGAEGHRIVIPHDAVERLLAEEKRP